MLVFGYFKKPKSCSAAIPRRTGVEALGTDDQLIQKPTPEGSQTPHLNQLALKERNLYNSHNMWY
jgi:hypothetical protein